MIDPEDEDLIRRIVKEEILSLFPPGSLPPSFSQTLNHPLSPLPPFSLSSEEEKKNSGRKKKMPVLMCSQVLEIMEKDPLYKGVDLADHALKFERWCKANGKLNTVRRFVNWINDSW